jgi:TP901 family phage tail tape measure protein
MPQSAETMASGLYNVVSSGFSGQDAMTILEASGKAASAGQTDTETASRAILAALNAYGLAAKDATDVSDILFKTVDKGVINFPQLANGIGGVMSTAAMAKVPLEQVGAAIATMTLSGITPDESITALNNMILKTIDPSEKMAAVIKKAGYESGAALLAAKGLPGVLDLIAEASGGAVEKVQELYPEIRAFKGAASMMAQGGGLLARNLEEIADPAARAGATTKAFNIQMAEASSQLTLAKNTAMAAVIEFGEGLLPVVIDLAKGAKALADQFRNLTPAQKEAWAKAVLWGGALLVAGGAAMKVTGFIIGLNAQLAILRLASMASTTALGAETTALEVEAVAVGSVTKSWWAAAAAKAGYAGVSAGTGTMTGITGAGGLGGSLIGGGILAAPIIVGGVLINQAVDQWAGDATAANAAAAKALADTTSTEALQQQAIEAVKASGMKWGDAVAKASAYRRNKLMGAARDDLAAGRITQEAFDKFAAGMKGQDLAKMRSVRGTADWVLQSLHAGPYKNQVASAANALPTKNTPLIAPPTAGEKKGMEERQSAIDEWQKTQRDILGAPMLGTGPTQDLGQLATLHPGLGGELGRNQKALAAASDDASKKAAADDRALLQTRLDSAYKVYQENLYYSARLLTQTSAEGIAAEQALHNTRLADITWEADERTKNLAFMADFERTQIAKTEETRKKAEDEAKARFRAAQETNAKLSGSAIDQTGRRQNFVYDAVEGAVGAVADFVGGPAGAVMKAQTRLTTLPGRQATEEAAAREAARSALNDAFLGEAEAAGVSLADFTASAKAQVEAPSGSAALFGMLKAGTAPTWFSSMVGIASDLDNSLADIWDKYGREGLDVKVNLAKSSMELYRQTLEATYSGLDYQNARWQEGFKKGLDQMKPLLSIDITGAPGQTIAAPPPNVPALPNVAQLAVPQNQLTQPVTAVPVKIVSETLSMGRWGETTNGAFGRKDDLVQVVEIAGQKYTRVLESLAPPNRKEWVTNASRFTAEETAASLASSRAAIADSGLGNMPFGRQISDLFAQGVAPGETRIVEVATKDVPSKILDALAVDLTKAGGVAYSSGVQLAQLASTTAGLVSTATTSAPRYYTAGAAPTVNVPPLAMPAVNVAAPTVNVPPLLSTANAAPDLLTKVADILGAGGVMSANVGFGLGSAGSLPSLGLAKPADLSAAAMAPTGNIKLDLTIEFIPVRGDVVRAFVNSAAQAAISRLTIKDASLTAGGAVGTW